MSAAAIEMVGYTKLSGRRDTRLPLQLYFELVSQAGQTPHPQPGSTQ
jgi:hypothetical protein